jgi:voltage-gated potassium channel
VSFWRARRGASLVERIARGDTYVLLFLLLLVYYFTLSLVPLNRFTRLLIVSIGVVTLLLALHTSHVGRRFLRVALVASAAAVVFAAVEFVSGDPLFSGSSFIAIGLLLLTTPAVILRRILGHRRVDIETIAGAVDVYLLLGLLFGFVYLAIGDVSSDPFFEQIAKPDMGDFVYFSFVTLTTVGYGDLTPADNLGRTLAPLEAVFGAVFLVTLVARLVSLYGTERRPGVLLDENHDSDSDSDSDR